MQSPAAYFDACRGKKIILVPRSAPRKQFLKGQEALALSEMFSEEKTWKSR